MFYVYLIKSKKDSTYYIGLTKDLKNRIKEHNQGKTKSIKHRIPFQLIYYEAYSNRKSARRRELELKKNSFKKKELLKRF
jgi:putative endonuclease